MAAPNTPADSNEDQAHSECPFCVMMRKGGCEAPFQEFMACGEKADRGDYDMADCVKYFEALHVCMESNKAVFDSLLEEMKAEEAAAVGSSADGSCSDQSPSESQKYTETNMQAAGNPTTVHGSSSTNVSMPTVSSRQDPQAAAAPAAADATASPRKAATVSFVGGAARAGAPA